MIESSIDSYNNRDIAPMLKLIRTEDGYYDDTTGQLSGVYTYLVSGSLADNVRRKWGLAEGVEVLLVEDAMAGGYSTETIENSFEFTVKAGGKSQFFSSIGSCEKYFGGSR